MHSRVARVLRARRAFSAALLTSLALFGASVLLAAAPPAPARAASLVQITNFGNNPTGLQMWLYVPNSVAPKPAILLALHFCTGTGPVFFQNTEFASLADRFGFIVIYPSATRSGQCWDVSTPGSLSHNATSDPAGLISMVTWVEQNRNGDPNRVFVTGASSGAMMTNVLLGDFPDVFKAGSAFMGVPFACFATTDGSLWNSQCANGQISKTPQQWGDLVRGAFPGFSGARPRMQVWHGTADTTLFFPNFGEEIKQWTNVLGVSQTPVFTDSPQSGWMRTRYGNSSVTAPVEGISVQGAGHVLPLTGMAAMAISFMGLDSAPPPPTSTATPTARATSTSTPVGTATATRTATPVVTATATRTATPSGTGSACKVTYTMNAWNNGFTASLTLANTGTTTINGWTLVFTLPSGQTFQSGWNANYTGTTGQITATNVSFNGTIAPGSSVSDIGFQAAHNGNTSKPASFTLNGTLCSMG